MDEILESLKHGGGRKTGERPTTDTSPYELSYKSKSRKSMTPPATENIFQKLYN